MNSGLWLAHHGASPPKNLRIYLYRTTDDLIGLQLDVKMRKGHIQESKA